MTNIISVDALVIGTGAAGYNAAIRLNELGVQTAIITEEVRTGTSRNTGSDKQTYYKLGLGGDSIDSVRKMAEDLFAGGSVDGDNALCEAALSSRCFMQLCELGVPFPVNRYGEYIGYKTDHDPHARATSAGPLTSKIMTEVLEQETSRRNIPVYNKHYAVEILKDETGVCGLLCLNVENGSFTAFRTSNIIMATGGPAGIYADSVYPQCHTGSTSLAILAGADFQNMTHWQYGLASINPRWNVSGTYMQALPRFISVDAEGIEREFLLDYFGDANTALSCVFLKGYQWPFDSSKVMDGSSVIDLLVYRETAILERKVYLDYRTNPFGLDNLHYDALSSEARNYLKNADACFGTPIDRLLHMNTPAYELYLQKGLDLKRSMLPIALCAQHCNGGIAVDLWWQTTVPGLFAAGECAGTHGIARPGGSALNAGQVGALRAAQYIAQYPRKAKAEGNFSAILNTSLKNHQAFKECFLKNPENVDALLSDIRKQMSISGAAIRDKKNMQETLIRTCGALKSIKTDCGTGKERCLNKAYQYRDALVCQIVCLCAMVDYGETAGSTQGSALYQNAQGKLREGLNEVFRFFPDKFANKDKIQYGNWNDGNCTIQWRPVRKIPDSKDVFETVWRSFRDNQNIY